MSYQEIDILSHWLVNTPLLLQRVCTVVVAVYIAIRLPWLRRAIRGAATHWRSRFITAVFLASWPFLGTHNGIVLDAGKNGVVIDNLTELPTALQPLQAILSFRDMMVFVRRFGGRPLGWPGRRLDRRG